jgi:hypothetical protein
MDLYAFKEKQVGGYASSFFFYLLQMKSLYNAIEMIG